MIRSLASWLMLGALLGTFGCSVNNARNQYVLAEKLWTDGKYAASVAEFEKVIAQDPHGKLGVQALYRAAMTQSLFLFQYSDAVRKFKEFRNAVGDTPAAWDAEKQIGEIYFTKTEQYDQAIQHYQTLLKEKPKAEEAPEFWFRIGKSHFFLGQFDEAIKIYQSLVKEFPSSPWAEKAYFEIGVTDFTRGEQRPGDRGPGMEAYQDAIDAYQRFLARYPKSELVPQAKYGIASCLEELDQLDAAYHAFEALKSVYPSRNVIEIKLARIRERKLQRSR